MKITLTTELQSILNDSDEQRARYFFQAANKQQEIWLLTDQHGCVMLTTEDEDCIPVWPNKELALIWATDEWQECQAQAIYLKEWYQRWTPGLIDDDLALVVFPNEKEQGLVFSPEELEHEMIYLPLMTI